MTWKKGTELSGKCEVWLWQVKNDVEASVFLELESKIKKQMHGPWIWVKDDF